MIEAVLLDKKRMLPCTAFLEGEYGCDGIFFGVPVTLGITGIENIIELKLTDEEKKAINTSAQDVKQMIDEVDRFLNES
jgi:malate dehydrogenase